jgi:hypothetical protein
MLARRYLATEIASPSPSPTTFTPTAEACWAHLLDTGMGLPWARESGWRGGWLYYYQWDQAVCQGLVVRVARELVREPGPDFGALVAL